MSFVQCLQLEQTKIFIILSNRITPKKVLLYNNSLLRQEVELNQILKERSRSRYNIPAPYGPILTATKNGTVIYIQITYKYGHT